MASTDMEGDSNPYRIALFFHDLGIGGAERVMLQLAQGFMEVGHPVDLVLAWAEGPLLAEVPFGVQIIDLKTRSPIKMFLGLLRYLRKNRPGVLLSPFEVTSVIAILAKKITRVPTRVVIRVSVHLSRNKRTTKWKKVLEQLVVSRVYPLADGIITVSKGVAEDLTCYTGIPLERINVIYNPVISEQLMQSAEQSVHHRFFAEGQYPVILGVGRLAEQKDFSTLIKAFHILHRKIPSRLIILGEGEERSVLEALIRSCSLQDMVDLPGVDINPFAFMKKASVFVLSSKWEGLPGVLIQALACGCPVVSTDCLSGPAEILKDGEYGYLVPVGDVEAVAGALEAILRGDVRKPPEGWLEQFTTASVIPQYRAVFGI